MRIGTRKAKQIRAYIARQRKTKELTDRYYGTWEDVYKAYDIAGKDQQAYREYILKQQLPLTAQGLLLMGWKAKSYINHKNMLR